MDLQHHFSVPTGVEETWAHFGDIVALAECFPGAQVTSADGDTFSGSVKVKLGPIALVYNGSGTFVDKDDTAHSFTVDAKGKDKRGNGTAGAHVTLTMAENATGGTDVSVVTDLAITGKPAQFGRGVMQDVSDKLLGQFVACLEQRLGGEPEPSGTAPDATTATTEDPTAAPVGETPIADALAAAAPTAVAAPTARAAAAAPASPRPVRPAPPAQDDALDLGAAVLPVLLKGYWKQGVAALAVLLVAWRVLRR